MSNNIKDRILKSLIHGRHTTSREIASTILERQEVVVSYIQELLIDHKDWFLTGTGYGDDQLSICLHPGKISDIKKFVETGGYQGILDKIESDKELDRNSKAASIRATKIAYRSYVVSIIAAIIALTAIIISLISK